MTTLCNLITFFDNIGDLLEKENVIELIYLVSSKAFDVLIQLGNMGA